MALPRRHGPPRIGAWWDFTRLPGRARSHTKTRPAWETYRLVGTLDGHLAAHRSGTRPTPEQTTPAAWTSRDQAKTTSTQADWRHMTH